MNASNNCSENLGTCVAAPAATKFSAMPKAAPMMAAAANLHLYQLCGLMSKFNFSESLHGGQGSKPLMGMPLLRRTLASGKHFSFPVPRTSGPAIRASGPLAAEEPAYGGGSLGSVISRHQSQAEGPRR